MTAKRRNDARELRNSQLEDFLLARIAEDLAELPQGSDCWYSPERYEAEAQVKRRLVELHAPDSFGDCRSCGGGGEFCDAGPSDLWPCDTILVLASVYADHPDYRQGWRP